MVRDVFRTLLLLSLSACEASPEPTTCFRLQGTLTNLVNEGLVTCIPPAYVDAYVDLGDPMASLPYIVSRPSATCEVLFTGQRFELHCRDQDCHPLWQDECIPWGDVRIDVEATRTDEEGLVFGGVLRWKMEWPEEFYYLCLMTFDVLVKEADGLYCQPQP